MKCYAWLVLTLAYNGIAAAAEVHTIHYPQYAKNVGDTFDIYISYVSAYDSGRVYSTAYYSDADIESGEALRDALASDSLSESARHTIFIGIGQRHDYHHLRRRDYIPPLMDDGQPVENEDPLHRHADKYYAYLKDELIPAIESRYKVNDRRTIIGHSFGGLFVFYTLLKEERIFTSYLALSPSFWKDQFNIFDYEEAYHRKHSELPAYVYLSTGSRETLNYVRKGNRRMKALLETRAYKGFQLEYFEHKGKVHSTQVPISFAWIMTHVRF